MNIAIDANEANVTNRVGTGQYAYNLLKYWHKNLEHTFTLYLRDAPRSNLSPARPGWDYRVIGPRFAWTRLALPTYLLTHKKPDVFFNPAHYLPPLMSCPSVVTVHDLAYEFYPEYFLPRDLYKLRRWTRQSVERATKIIAVSASTKRDLLKLYDVPDDKVTVVANGYDATLFNIKSRISHTILKRHQLSTSNYVLYMGTIQPRKNLITLVQAYELMREKGYSGKLVLAGKVGWLANDTLEYIKSSKVRRDIILPGYVTDEERAALYRHAEVFVLPSLYEGFGVGVLEAMASGCPVVASNTSSLPEVVGRAGLLFNPSDHQALANSLNQAIKARHRLVKAGLLEVKKYSWEKCAAETLTCLVS